MLIESTNFTASASNRTKVELKRENCRLRCNLGGSFQSNQSGIETPIQGGLCPPIWLPIEPKWNWNRAEAKIKAKKMNFQSNQSGIETIIQLPLMQLMFLPIEPKWNWNF